MLAFSTLAYALLATDWPGRPVSVQSITAAGLTLLTLLAMGLVRRRHRRQVDGLVLLFDGRGWFNDGGDLATVISVYAAAGLLAARVEVTGQRYPLLLCRAHYSREGWRRLRLALGLLAASGR